MSILRDDLDCPVDIAYEFIDQTRPFEATSKPGLCSTRDVTTRQQVSQAFPVDDTRTSTFGAPEEQT